MSETKHTPGPWILAKDRQSIYQTNHITRDIWTIPHCDADMDLIAEAPGLLAVAERLCCQFAMAGIDAVPDSNDPTEDLHAQALSAVLRARGEPVDERFVFRMSEDPRDACRRLNAEKGVLLKALKGLDALYTHAWDLADRNGEVVFRAETVAKFEKLHEAATRAIARAEGRAQGKEG